MKPLSVGRRSLVLGAAPALIMAPAIIGRAQAATTKLKLSSSLPNDPKYANGRVFSDNLTKQIKAAGLDDRIEIAFFPDNQLGQEIDVINSVKLGVIDLMVSGSSISANLVPLVGTLDLGYLFTSYPQQTRALDAGAAKPFEDALLKGANIHIIGWAYNFGARSVLSKKQVKTPEDLAGLKIRTLPNPVITECLRLMGAAATPLAFGEIYTALQAGVLDGLEHDPPTILASKFFETAKYYAPDRAYLLAAHDLFQRRELQAHGSQVARRLPRRHEKSLYRHPRPRPRRREGSARHPEAEGRHRDGCRQGSLPQARPAADGKFR